MDIPDAQETLWKIEKQILSFLQEFEKQTGLFVEDVFIIRGEVSKVRNSYLGNIHSSQIIDIDIKVIIEGKQDFSFKEKQTFFLRRRVK